MSIDVFLSIAEISGIFIAFGALISAFGNSSQIEKLHLQGLVGAGLVVLIAALIPVGLSYFSIPEHFIMKWSSAGFLLVIWIVIIGTQDRELAPVGIEHLKSHLFFAGILIVLEFVIQISLLVTIFGALESYWESLFVLALLLNLLQAAIFLSHMILVKSASDT
ncbi:MAG: hypothetical protein H8D52_02095 [Gammaproteobacteria bacterium]|nr:hypothetical protein [Gammaproteobacteria bacterium]